MVVDLLEKERTNIKELVLPIPEGKNNFLFDPSKEISPDEWQEIIGYVQREISTDPFEPKNESGMDTMLDGRLALASAVKNLSNEQFSKLDTSIIYRRTGKTWPLKTKSIASFPGAFAQRLGEFKNLFTLSGVDIDFSVLWDDVKKNLIDFWVELPPSDSILEGKTLLKMVFPEKSADFAWPEGNLNVINEMLDVFRNTAEYPTNWDRFAEIAGKGRILLVGEEGELDLRNRDYQEMRKEWLRYKKEKNWTQVALMGSWIKLAAAEAVKITDQGIKIIMPDQNQVIDEKPNLPDIRKF